MKCLTCGRFCLQVLCKACLDSIPLRPSVREVMGVRVYCFYGYDDVSFLLNSKYYTIGSRILASLSDKAARYFAQTFDKSQAIGALTLIGIDDFVRSYYSHTGVIMRSFAKHTAMKACYGELRASSQVSYAGKPLAYRQANKRDLSYTAKAKDLVIVDDIITTGTSFSEAIEVCTQKGARVHLALALCNAQE
ncbi:ComF family protein [Helicobacter canis]|uniref:phosphoribosyltransferase n=1 Tax=Helicobacter canis TaxID=29419 RepID=UPI002942EA1B|nr:ComF family protein [Helicobacter canis]